MQLFKIPGTQSGIYLIESLLNQNTNQLVTMKSSRIKKRHILEQGDYDYEELENQTLLCPDIRHQTCLMSDNWHVYWCLVTIIHNTNTSNNHLKGVPKRLIPCKSIQKKNELILLTNHIMLNKIILSLSPSFIADHKFQSIPWSYFQSYNTF